MPWNLIFSNYQSSECAWFWALYQILGFMLQTDWTYFWLWTSKIFPLFVWKNIPAHLSRDKTLHLTHIGKQWDGILWEIILVFQLKMPVYFLGKSPPKILVPYKNLFPWKRIFRKAFLCGSGQSRGKLKELFWLSGVFFCVTPRMSCLHCDP